MKNCFNLHFFKTIRHHYHLLFSETKDVGNFFLSFVFRLVSSPPRPQTMQATRHSEWWYLHEFELDLIKIPTYVETGNAEDGSTIQTHHFEQCIRCFRISDDVPYNSSHPFAWWIFSNDAHNTCENWYEMYYNFKIKNNHVKLNEKDNFENHLELVFASFRISQLLLSTSAESCQKLVYQMKECSRNCLHRRQQWSSRWMGPKMCASISSVLRHWKKKNCIIQFHNYRIQRDCYHV